MLGLLMKRRFKGLRTFFLSSVARVQLTDTSLFYFTLSHTAKNLLLTTRLTGKVSNRSRVRGGVMRRGESGYERHPNHRHGQSRGLMVQITEAALKG